MPSSLLRPQRLRLLVLLMIVAVGAAFRFGNLGYMGLSYDNSYPMYGALHILDDHDLPLVGQPSSVFLDNPPLMSYVQAIPLLLWRSPWAVAIFIVALNTLAIWLVWRVAQQLLGDLVGYLSAFLFAVNPWVVLFSRATSVQSLIPFFTALIAAGLWPTLATENRSPSRVFVAGLAVTAMTQTYIEAMGALAQIGLLVAMFRKRIPRKPLYAGLLIFVAALMVYGVGLLGDWETNQAKLVKFFSGSEMHLNPDGLDHAVRLVTGLDFDAQMPGQSGENSPRRMLSLAVHDVLSLALIAGIIRAVVEVWQRSGDRSSAVVLLVWFSTPILLTSVSANPVHPHYLLLSCPAGHILASWGMLPLLRRTGVRWICCRFSCSSRLWLGSTSIKPVRMLRERRQRRSSTVGLWSRLLSLGAWCETSPRLTATRAELAPTATPRSSAA